MINDIIKRVLKEATSDGGGRGSYVAPLQMGLRKFKNSQNQPFTNQVSKYDSPDLEYDSYDGSMQTPKKERKKLEREAEKVTNYIKKHPNSTNSDDDGNDINDTPGNGKKIVPIKEWVELDSIVLNEDLAVWFGTKKKPKGTKQPKGPWVDICRKVNGKHPPCGRPDTDKGAYPKCRAAGVAGKMSDSDKKAACSQKRRAEKKDTQTGKGQKPIMTHYEPKKKRTQKESLDIIIKNILSNL